MKQHSKYYPAGVVASLTAATLLSGVTISQAENRVHSAGNFRMNINDNGTIGNRGALGGGVEDPEHPGEWAPQCEFPAGSGVQYLFQGGLWVGALIREEGYEYPRVSVGLDGWVWPSINEMSAHPDSRIIERSNIRGAQDYLGNEIYSPDAVATQEFLTTYYDTLADPELVNPDPVDSLHESLGLKISQKSMVWSDADLADIIIIQWEIENVGDRYLKNIYLGLHIDGDVGANDEDYRFEDDLCGFRPQRYEVRIIPGNDTMVIDSFEINMAYIADNDGRPCEVASGNDFTAPGVSGVMMLDAPNPELKTSFNWWTSHADPELDFGPGWEDDDAPGGWTSEYGTPMGDVRKYFLMRNRENDYDAVRISDPEYIESNPQVFLDRFNGDTLESHNWRSPIEDDELPQRLCGDIAGGFDAKYLLSWGPLGVFDHVDEEGNRIYRLHPGERFTVTVAYVCAEEFHDPNNPQPDNEVIDPALFNFGDIQLNAERAQWAFDNFLGVRGEDAHSSLPSALLLNPPFPSPFNSTAIVSFQTPFAGVVQACLVDASGRVVRGFEIPPFAGMKNGRFLIDGAGLSAGTYWVKVAQGGQNATQRGVLVK